LSDFAEDASKPLRTPVRILLAKIGLDGHDRGVKVVALGLRDAGFEVIYTGLHKMPEAVAEIALQEDVDVVGVSILSGAHETLVPRLLDALKAQSTPIPVVVGGFIPDDDIQPLLDMGVARIFLADTPIATIAHDLREIAGAARARDEAFGASAL
jgi:methylmalonyl-CoA mutase C-terminal domain/subunit